MDMAIISLHTIPNIWDTLNMVNIMDKAKYLMPMVLSSKEALRMGSSKERGK